MAIRNPGITIEAAAEVDLSIPTLGVTAATARVGGRRAPSTTTYAHCHYKRHEITNGTPLTIDLFASLTNEDGSTIAAGKTKLAGWAIEVVTVSGTPTGVTIGPGASNPPTNMFPASGGVNVLTGTSSDPGRGGVVYPTHLVLSTTSRNVTLTVVGTGTVAVSILALLGD